MDMAPNEYRKSPVVFRCFEHPEVKALNSRMVELAAEMAKDVETYLDAFAETGRFPDMVYGALGAFRETYDRFLWEVLQREEIQVSCKPGCSVCCFELPCGVEPLEILQIYDRIRRWPDAMDVLRNSFAAMRTFREICIELEEETGETVESGSAVYGSALNRFVKNRIPCTLLDTERGLCRVYDIRPLICRGVFAVSEPAFCDPSHADFGGENHQVRVIEPIDEINYVLMRINVFISHTLGFRFPEVLPHGLLVCHDRGLGSG